MEQLEGKVAVVTGGGSGIGEGIIGACVEAGMRVVVADIDLDEAERVASAARESGADALAVQVDVSDRIAMDALAERAYEDFGEVNLLFCNAGVITEASIEDSTDADWEWLFRVNVMGVVHGAQAFVPRMREQEGEAHIVNTGSIAGIFVPRLDIGSYAASKHAVIAISGPSPPRGRRRRHRRLGALPRRGRDPAVRGAPQRAGGPRGQRHVRAAQRGLGRHLARSRRQAGARRRAGGPLLGDHAPAGGGSRAARRALRGAERRLRVGPRALVSATAA